MNTILIFPPRTSPTYTPLGIACLNAAAKTAGEPVEIFDANLELWNALCDAESRLGALRDFSRGAMDRFLNPAIYDWEWNAAIPGAAVRLGELERQARGFLNGEGLGTELNAVFARQTAVILKNAPDTVGFSAMYPDQLPFLLAHARYLARLRCVRRIVVGGAAASCVPPVELLSAAPFLDAVLTGEGEIPFVALLRGAPPERIPGCFFRDGRGAVAEALPPESVADLGILPAPDFDGLPVTGYFNPVPVLPIYGCRGCRWRRCRFCTHNRSFGKFRIRPPREVASEMVRRTAQYGCRHFYMVDQYVDPEYLDALSDAILETGAECRFQAMARTIGAYTPALLEKAARAGCRWLSWGMESGSQTMLDRMNKGTRADVSREVIRNAREAGISNLLMMIFGAPGETRETAEETFAFLENAWPDIDGMTASAFVLFEGTAFGLHPEQYGLEVLASRPILELEGKPICDGKLPFRRTGENTAGESPLAAMMIEDWERRKAWLPPLPFHGKLCCEHYLLYADARRAAPRPGSRPRSA